MKRLYLLGLSLILIAVFGKLQGKGWHEHHFFRLAPEEVETYPGYLAKMGIKFLLVVLAFSHYHQEEKYRSETCLFFCLIFGWWIDYILRRNISWFHIGQYAVSYETFAALAFATVLLKASGLIGTKLKLK